ncbi:hypothetical protein BJX76DRAFT_188968 [Aspergillus varians]
MADSPDLEALRATQPLLHEGEYDSYSWVLLEDHPLRSYPTGADCHPEISAFTRKLYAMVRRCLRERVLPLLCLLLMFFVIVQFLLQLPHVASYFLEPVDTRGLSEFIQTPATAGQSFDRTATCVFESPGPSQMDGVTHDADAVGYALASGCTGVKINLWQRNRSLLVGNDLSSFDDERTLQNIYLRPLQLRLDARNSASNDSIEKHNDMLDDVPPVGLFDEDPLQPFTLFLGIQTPMQTAWPLLDAQLRSLNQNGYLSYRNAEQELVVRPVTVVVSGRGGRRLSLMADLSRIMKGLF